MKWDNHVSLVILQGVHLIWGLKEMVGMEAFCKTLHLSVMQGTRVKCQMTSVKHAVPMTLAITLELYGMP